MAAGRKDWDPAAFANLELTSIEVVLGTADGPWFQDDENEQSKVRKKTSLVGVGFLAGGCQRNLGVLVLFALKFLPLILSERRYRQYGVHFH